MESILKPIQAGGLLQAWRNPDGSFHQLFLKLDLDCEPEKYPGILIASDISHRHVLVAAVKNLHKELPLLLKQIEGKEVVYWWREEDGHERSKILSGLTGHPVFVG